MRPLTVLGLTANKRSGKDTLASFLEEEYIQLGYKVYRYAFADELKAITRRYFPTWNGQKTESSGDFVGGRQILEGVGTLVRDLCGSSYWVKKVSEKINATISEHPRDQRLVIIITDIRYRNEADLVKQMGGKIIKIVRDGYNSDSFSAEMGVSDMVLKLDHILENNGTIQQLQQKAIQLIQKMHGEQAHALQNN